MEKTIIHIEGMTCGHCVRAVKNMLEEVKGVEEATVDLNDKKAVVAFDPSVTSAQALIDHLNSSNTYKASAS